MQKNTERFYTAVYQLKEGLSTDALKIDENPDQVNDRHVIVAGSHSNEILRLEYIERIAEGDLLNDCDADDKIQAITEIVRLPSNLITTDHLDKLICTYHDQAE